MRVYQNGAYHWAEPSATRFAHWSANGSQAMFNFPAEQIPEKYMRMRGLIYNVSASKLMLIGQRGNGNWVDWGDLMNWGYCLEMNHLGTNNIFERPAGWALGNGGLYIHKLGLTYQ